METRRKIKHLALMCHPTHVGGPQLVSTILDWGKQHALKIFIDHATAQKMEIPELGLSRIEMAEMAEMIVVLGGDGSILQAVRMFARNDIPIAGVNLGHLGFLTLGSAQDALKIFERLRLGQYHIENRLMMAAQVWREGKVVHRGIAVNDVVVVKEPISRVIDIEVSISGTNICSFRGDGIIISTPTGSTAYSLSAGGPIIPPWVDALLLCPLASHTLNARPVITSDREVFSARLSCSHSAVDLVIDGQEGFGLIDGDQIEVCRAEETAKIVVLQQRNFFKILRKKMKWGK